MNRRALPALLVALALSFTPLLRAANPKPASAPLPYRGAILLDAADGRILFEEGADRVSPPASMTKLMTYLLVHDRIAEGGLTWETPVAITREDAGLGGTQVWLKEGEIFTVEDLTFALLIQSANDAAVALARAVAGSRAAFVERMTARARELGMAATTFRTPHGLPPANRRPADGDLTTPRDMAVLARHLLRGTDVLRFSSVRERPFRPGQPAPREVIMRNHNHLLTKVDGADGLKTGYTASAGFCLAATAERGGRRVIAVVMGSPDSKSRDIKVAELLEKGFAASPPLAEFRPDGASPLRPVTASPPPRTTPSTGATPSPATAPAAEPLPTVRFVRPKP
jgi:D-alanyl-D-alanine carboxypeptidase